MAQLRARFAVFVMSTLVVSAVQDGVQVSLRAADSSLEPTPLEHFKAKFLGKCMIEAAKYITDAAKRAPTCDRLLELFTQCLDTAPTPQEPIPQICDAFVEAVRTVRDSPQGLCRRHT